MHFKFLIAWAHIIHIYKVKVIGKNILENNAINRLANYLKNCQITSDDATRLTLCEGYAMLYRQWIVPTVLEPKIQPA
jgi:hypothetical protein